MTRQVSDLPVTLRSFAYHNLQEEEEEEEVDNRSLGGCFIDT